MLSYRHGYHAGNFADVLKHLLLIAILQYLKKKQTPWYYHDTHAGAGIYPIAHPYMQKNQEYMTGIGRLWGSEVASPLLRNYLEIIQQVNPTAALTVYPGSPEIASRLMRNTDRAWLGEMHPADFKLLSDRFGKRRRIQCEKMDAWQGLKAKLPPKENRGLIFIDPSYEIDRDYKRVHTGIAEAYQRFAQGIYAIWYPDLDRRISDKFLRRFAESGIANIIHLHLLLPPPAVGPGMQACGMVIINPPYTLVETMQHALPELVSLLANGSRQGGFRVAVLAGERE